MRYRSAMVALAASAAIAACGGGTARNNTGTTFIPAIPSPLIPTPAPSISGMPGVTPPTATPSPSPTPTL